MAIASKKSLRRNLLANEVDVSATAVFPSGAVVSEIGSKMQVCNSVLASCLDPSWYVVPNIHC